METELSLHARHSRDRARPGQRQGPGTQSRFPLVEVRNLSHHQLFARVCVSRKLASGATASHQTQVLQHGTWLYPPAPHGNAGKVAGGSMYRKVPRPSGDHCWQ